MWKTFGVLVVALSWLSIRVMGQTHPVAVHAAHLLDVKSGKTLNDQTIVIEAGKIVSVGPAAAAKLPADAVRIDLPHATVLPGLIDAHTHLTMDPKFGYEQLRSPVRGKPSPGQRMPASHCWRVSPPCATSGLETTRTLPCVTRSTPATFRDRARW